MILIDGKEVWRLKATHGLPLDISLVYLARNGMVPTWGALFNAAAKDGTNIKRLIRECIFLVRESYEPENAQEIIKRLDYCSSSLQTTAQTAATT